MVDEDAGHADLLRRGRRVEQLADLGNHDSAGIVRGLGDGEHLAEKALFVRHEVAERIGRRGADQRDVDRNRLVPEPGLSAQFDAFDHARRRPLVEPTALDRGIDERIQSDVGDAARPAGGDVAKQAADDALRKIVGFDLALDRHPTDSRREAPMPADHAPHQALVGEMIDAAVFAVALAGGVDHRQIARRMRRKEASLKGAQKRLGHARPDEAARGDGLAVLDEPEGVGGGHQFAVARRGHPHHPPLTWIVCPVMYAARSLQRKRIALAISSGSPNRPSGTFLSISARTSSGMVLPMPVRITPGATALTVMLPLGEFPAEHFGQTDDAGLGRRVVALAEETDHAGDRREIDDPPAVRKTLAGRLAHLKDAGQVGVDHVVPLLDAHLLDRPVADDAGVVHEDVETAEPPDGFVDHPLEGRRVANVGRQRHGPTGLHAGGRLFGQGPIRSFRVVEVVDHDVGARLVQPPRGGLAQALPTARDNRRLAGKIQGNHKDLLASGFLMNTQMNSAGRLPRTLVVCSFAGSK